MAWFARKKEAQQATLVAAMSEAFAKALGGVLSAQTEQIKQSTSFLNTLQDLSARRAAQVLGGRGGRTTQRRRAERRAATSRPPDCALCKDPMRRGVTLEMIAFHRQHEARGDDGLQLALPVQSEERGDDERGN